MRKGDERKASLLRAAKELFFSRGYAATSVNDILDTQHVSKGSFYHHFESKLEVLTELCKQHQLEAAERYRSAVKDDMSALEKLDLLLYHALPANPEETQMCALLLQLYRTPEGDQVISAMLAAQKNAFFGLFAGLLEALAAEGQAYLPLDALPVRTIAAGNFIRGIPDSGIAWCPTFEKSYGIPAVFGNLILEK